MPLKRWQPHMASSSSNTILTMESSYQTPGSNTTRSAPIHSSHHMMGCMLTTPNGLADIRIRDIQANYRAMMIHAQQKWPESITANLWPDAFIHSNNAYNATPWLAHPQGLSTLQLFIVTQVQDNPQPWHTFGCPTYVLNEELWFSHRIHH